MLEVVLHARDERVHAGCFQLSYRKIRRIRQQYQIVVLRKTHDDASISTGDSIRPDHIWHPELLTEPGVARRGRPHETVVRVHPFLVHRLATGIGYDQI